jgi:hypothetical protein
LELEIAGSSLRRRLKPTPTYSQVELKRYLKSRPCQVELKRYLRSRPCEAMEILLKDESRGDAGAAGAVDATREAGRRPRTNKAAAATTTPAFKLTPEVGVERGSSRFRHPNDGQPLAEAEGEEQPLGRASRLGGYRQGLTHVHVRARVEQLQDSFVSYVGLYGGQMSSSSAELATSVSPWLQEPQRRQTAVGATRRDAD